LIDYRLVIGSLPFLLALPFIESKSLSVENVALLIVIFSVTISTIILFNVYKTKKNGLKLFILLLILIISMFISDYLLYFSELSSSGIKINNML
jgi:hypothetical protein